jgi:hypothetical protein
MFCVNFSALCQQNGIDERPTRLAIGIPNANDLANKMWFDELIRVPDHIAGAVSAFPFEIGRVSGAIDPKFQQILEHSLADNPNHIIVALQFLDDRILGSRILLSRNPL